MKDSFLTFLVVVSLLLVLLVVGLMLAAAWHGNYAEASFWGVVLLLSDQRGRVR